jgi:hypothetical protein
VHEFLRLSGWSWALAIAFRDDSSRTTKSSARQHKDDECSGSQRPRSPPQVKLTCTWYEYHASTRLLNGDGREVFSVLGRGIQIVDLRPDSPAFRDWRILFVCVVDICHGVHQSDTLSGLPFVIKLAKLTVAPGREFFGEVANLSRPVFAPPVESSRDAEIPHCNKRQLLTRSSPPTLSCWLGKAAKAPPHFRKPRNFNRHQLAER